MTATIAEIALTAAVIVIERDNVVVILFILAALFLVYWAGH